MTIYLHTAKEDLIPCSPDGGVLSCFFEGVCSGAPPGRREVQTGPGIASLPSVTMGSPPTPSPILPNPLSRWFVQYAKQVRLPRHLQAFFSFSNLITGPSCEGLVQLQ